MLASPGSVGGLREGDVPWAGSAIRSASGPLACRARHAAAFLDRRQPRQADLQLPAEDLAAAPSATITLNSARREPLQRRDEPPVMMRTLRVRWGWASVAKPP